MYLPLRFVGNTISEPLLTLSASSTGLRRLSFNRSYYTWKGHVSCKKWYKTGRLFCTAIGRLDPVTSNKEAVGIQNLTHFLCLSLWMTAAYETGRFDFINLYRRRYKTQIRKYAHSFGWQNHGIVILSTCTQIRGWVFCRHQKADHMQKTCLREDLLSIWDTQEFHSLDPLE